MMADEVPLAVEVAKIAFFYVDVTPKYPLVVIEDCWNYVWCHPNQ